MSEDAAGLSGFGGFALLLLYFAWKRGWKLKQWDELFIYVVTAGVIVAGVIARLAVIT